MAKDETDRMIQVNTVSLLEENEEVTFSKEVKSNAENFYIE